MKINTSLPIRQMAPATAACAQARAAVGGAGLVPIQTSDSLTRSLSSSCAGSAVLSGSRLDTGPAFSDCRLFVDAQMMRMGKLKRSVMTSGRLHQEECAASGRRFKVAFVTLTYRDDVDWEPRHITQFIKRVRDWCVRRGVDFRYVGVLETTKRKRPHYHLAIWLPMRLSLPKPDKRGWWDHGFSNIQLARMPLAYLAKYTSKGSDCYPCGARIYGTGGLSRSGRVARRWWLAPKWLRDQVPLGDVRKERGGWRNEKGDIFLSPFVYSGLASGGFYIRKRRFDDPFRIVKDMSEAKQVYIDSRQQKSEFIYLNLLQLQDTDRFGYLNYLDSLMSAS
jgi:hypothetical protein